MEISGKFKVSGVGWLCYWNKNHNQWLPIMELSPIQIEYWKNLEIFENDKEW
jgi:hypothetical protein